LIKNICFTLTKLSVHKKTKLGVNKKLEIGYFGPFDETERTRFVSHKLSFSYNCYDLSYITYFFYSNH